MAGGIVCTKTALVRSNDQGSWVLGTLYVHENDLRFEPASHHHASVTSHLIWPAVSTVHCRRIGLFNGIELAHSAGVEVFCCLGAERFSRVLASALTSSRESLLAA